tara:strand:- start:735 stop:1736 length:1002 start_codon:yes stop_codon:yes gene_type:complete
MAKSSLTFSERRKVLTLGSSSDHAVRTLTKQDCGKIIVLTNAQAHAITLPTAAEAGEGWNCRFVLGTLHTDRSVRDLTSIAAQGTETVSLVAHKMGNHAEGALTTGAKAKTTSLIQIDANAGLKAENQAGATESDFTVNVPLAIGGTGETLKFVFKTTDAALTATNSAAGEVEVSTQNLANDAAIANEIVRIINGGDPVTAASVRHPASGTGALGTGVVGITAAITAGGGNEAKIEIEADKFGRNGGDNAAPAAGDTAVTFAYAGGAAHGDVDAKILGAADTIRLGATTPGARRTGVSLSTRTIQITEGAKAGDQVEVVVVNGQWQARSYRAH